MSKTNKQDLENFEKVRKRLLQRSDRLKAELQQIDDDLRAADRMMHLLNEEETKTEEIWPESYLREFEGLTQVQALVKIARTNGRNRLNVKDAKNLMVAAGLVKSKNNAANIVYTAIIRSERFRKIGKGEYELMTGTSPLLLTKAERQAG
jgi:hypothetical protein